MPEPARDAPPNLPTRNDLLKTVSGWYEQNRQDASSIAAVLTVTLSQVTTETMAAVVRNITTLVGEKTVAAGLLTLLSHELGPSEEEMRTLGLSPAFIVWMGSLVSRFSYRVARSFVLDMHPNAFGRLDVSFQQDKELDKEIVTLKLRHLSGQETIYEMPCTTWLSAIIDLLKPLVEKRLFVNPELRDGIVRLKDLVGKISPEETK